MQAGAGRIEALHDLQIDGQQRDRAEQRHADDEADGGRQHEGAIAEQGQRQQRIGHHCLGIDEAPSDSAAASEMAIRLTGASTSSVEPRLEMRMTHMYNVFDKTYVSSCANAPIFCFYGERRMVLATLKYRW